MELLRIVLFVCLCWFLLFGFTWDNTKYELDCSSERGVEFVTTPLTKTRGN